MLPRTIGALLGLGLISHTAMAQPSQNGTGDIGTRLFGSTYAYENLNTMNSSAVIGLADNSQMYFTVYNNLPMTFMTNGIEQMRITGSGAIGIGTTAPAYMLHVNGTVGGTSTWAVASDARLKKNIRPITGAIDLVERLRGVHYQWRPVAEREVGKDLRLPLGEPQIGFIAQEVEAVVPEAVAAPNPGSGDVYGLMTAKLMPILVEAMKEQQAEIRQLRATLADLQLASAKSLPKNATQ